MRLMQILKFTVGCCVHLFHEFIISFHHESLYTAMQRLFIDLFSLNIQELESGLELSFQK